MISMLIGTVAGQERNDDLVVNCGGVGYSVRIGKRDRKACEHFGKSVIVYARQVWHEAEGPALYGWLSERDRAFFDRLLSVNNVGPARAAGVVDAVDVDDFNALVEAKDTKTISKRFDGIGPKLAAAFVEKGAIK